MPYHWDDRAKLYADYQYLQDLHERLLVDLSAQLNRIHEVEHSLRYWRILIGPWLGYFVQMLFDRWSSIHQAVNEYDLSGTVLLTGREETLVPNDMADFIQLFVRDEWNHLIYAAILREFTSADYVERERHDTEETGQRESSEIPLGRRARNTLIGWCSSAASAFTREGDAFFLTTYLPIWDEMKLHLRFRQMPQLWRSVKAARLAVDAERRNWILGGENRTEFERCARLMIPRQVPRAYLEGYRELTEQAGSLPWPKRPKLIWTSNSENANDVFKAWAAEKTERGTPLVIGQHGGHYGTGRWSFTEAHEIAISDCYLSWGWTETQQPKVKPVGQFKSRRPLRVRHADQHGVLLVTTTLPRQAYHMYSAIMSRQWLDYFDDQCSFIERLPPSIQQALIVRLNSSDYGWDQAERWGERFPALRLDSGRSNINDLIRQAQLYVSTYNATTYLESLTMNVPTVIYWNPQHWELRASAVPYFDDLKRVGVFHESPDSAAAHVAAIWGDVDAWWKSSAVRTVVERCKSRYCDLPDDLLDRVESALRQVSADSIRSRKAMTSPA